MFFFCFSFKEWVVCVIEAGNFGLLVAKCLGGLSENRAGEREGGGACEGTGGYCLVEGRMNVGLVVSC